MKIHAYASAPHYAEHLHAVWRHLDDGLRGRSIEDFPTSAMRGGGGRTPLDDIVGTINDLL